MPTQAKIANQTKQRSTLKKLADIKDIENKEVTVFVGKGTVRTNEPFVILFYQSFIHLIVTEELTLTDLKVMLGILDFVSQGNVVHLTHLDIAKKMGLHRPQVSKSIQRLINAELLIQNEQKSLFVNPLIMSKENLRTLKESQAYELAKGDTPVEKLPF